MLRLPHKKPVSNSNRSAMPMSPCSASICLLFALLFVFVESFGVGCAIVASKPGNGLSCLCLAFYAASIHFKLWFPCTVIFVQTTDPFQSHAYFAILTAAAEEPPYLPCWYKCCWKRTQH